MQSLSRLPVMHITFWLNAYSIIKVFSFSTTFVKRIFGLGDLTFNYTTFLMLIRIIIPQHSPKHQQIWLLCCHNSLTYSRGKGVIATPNSSPVVVWPKVTAPGAVPSWPPLSAAPSHQMTLKHGLYPASTRELAWCCLLYLSFRVFRFC